MSRGPQIMTMLVLTWSIIDDVMRSMWGWVKPKCLRFFWEFPFFWVMTSLRRPNSNHRKPPYRWESLYVVILWWHPRRRHLWSDKKTQMKNPTSGKPSHRVAIINPLKYDIVGETNVCFLCCLLNKSTDHEGRSWLTVYLCASHLVLTLSEYRPSDIMDIVIQIDPITHQHPSTPTTICKHERFGWLRLLHAANEAGIPS